MTRANPVVALVGAGGIGHPAVVALAGEPIALRIIDDDRVESSNVHRLVAARDDELGCLKTDVALRVRREHATTASHGDIAICARVTPETALRLLAGADVVIEASDNYPTKFLVADACALLRIPSVHGAAVGWLGTVLSVEPGRSACYRCVFEDIPADEAVDCASAGVYGPVTSVIGAVMAADAMRIVRGEFAHCGTVGSYDGWRGTFRQRTIRRRPACALCGAQEIRNIEPSRYSPPRCAL